MNTRTYPRTSAQAFKGPDYACAVERPARRTPSLLAFAGVVMLALAAIAAIAR